MSGEFTPGMGLSDRLPSGIPDKFTDVSKYFTVIESTRPPRDGDLNEYIQANGGHLGRGAGGDEAPWFCGDEAPWFYAHKGYSERI